MGKLHSLRSWERGRGEVIVLPVLISSVPHGRLDRDDRASSGPCPGCWREPGQRRRNEPRTQTRPSSVTEIGRWQTAHKEDCSGAHSAIFDFSPLNFICINYCISGIYCACLKNARLRFLPDSQNVHAH